MTQEWKRKIWRRRKATGGDGEATNIDTRVSAAVAAVMMTMMMIFQWYELIYLALLYPPSSSSSAAATAITTETQNGHQKGRTDLYYF